MGDLTWWQAALAGLGIIMLIAWLADDDQRR